MPTPKALEISQEAGYDLVEVASVSSPPVCRVMDYGRFSFKQRKKRHGAGKQKQVSVKEVKFRPGIGDSDYGVKVKRLSRFLESGDRVKVVLRFRGREITHPELGFQLLERVRSDLETVSSVDQEPNMEGRLLAMVLTPGARARRQVATGSETSPVATGGETSPVATEGETSPVATGGETSPVATGGETSPVATGGETSPVATGGETSPVATGGETSPVATGSETSPVATGGKTSPVATGGKTSPVATGGETGGETSPVATGGETSPVATGGEASPEKSAG